MTKYVIDLPDNVSFIVGKGYVLFNEKEFLRIPVKQLEKYSKKEDVEVDKNEKIVFDGRKEEKMKISKDIYDALVEWRDANHLDHTHINGGDLLRLPTFILNFWLELGISQNEANNRLIAIIRWVNGEDVFEVEKPKKWVVRSKETDSTGKYHYSILSHFSDLPSMDYYFVYEEDDATKFDTREEAESWANSHQEVVEVVDV